MASGKHILGKGNSRRVFGTAKVGDRGQIVIPKEARDLFHIRPGDTLLIIGEENKGLIVSRPELLRDLADEIFESDRYEIWKNYWNYITQWELVPAFITTVSRFWIN